MFEALNVEKYCNENIIYHIWATPQDKINQSYLNEKKKELNKELQRWEDYFNQVKYHINFFDASEHLIIFYSVPSKI
jgi:hypothetical protein